MSHYEVWRQIWPDADDRVARARICKASTLPFAMSYMERDASMHLGYRVMIIDTRTDEIVSSVVKSQITI